MTIERQQVGATEFYGGRGITVRLMGPDFLCYVDKVELSNFFISPGAAVSAGQKYIDDERKAREQKK
jgi:hypothetical protein